MAEIKWAVVHRIVGISSNQVSLVVDDPGLEPWFLIDCASSLKGSNFPDHDYGRMWAITRGGDLYYKAYSDFGPTGFIGYFLTGPKMRFSYGERPIIQEAIKRYVKQQVE